MNQLILTLDHWTATVGALAWEQFLQSSVFITLVLLVDLFLHRKVSAGFRHALWLKITPANSKSIVSDSNYSNETAGKITATPKPDRLDHDMTLISPPQAKLSMSAYFLIFYTVVSIGFFVILWDRRRCILKDLKYSRRPPIWAVEALEAVRIQMKCRRKSDSN
ncbi:MAG TPA: hypothetical protein EYQ50_16560 [Verrucomicrobiales bacterium]|nr:hypothetical protein [Verrucomicrobiales bacterium]HIL71225.1 hypothetical protein [Verrucomicrobiota bacterium]